MIFKKLIIYNLPSNLCSISIFIYTNLNKNF